jgi:hypothetical protein
MGATEMDPNQGIADDASSVSRPAAVNATRIADAAAKLAGRAYGAIYSSCQDRTAALDGWLWH